MIVFVRFVKHSAEMFFCGLYMFTFTVSARRIIAQKEYISMNFQHRFKQLSNHTPSL